MAWLESHQSLRDHPKTRKLARRVGGIANAVGTLHCLWWWCLDYARDGDLTEHDHEDIAIGAAWEGEPETLIKHLVDCGFLENGSGLKVHDWMDYGGKTIQRREADAERKRKKIPSELHRNSTGTPPDGARTYIQTDIHKGRSATGKGQEPVDNSGYCPNDGATIQPDGHCPVCEWRAS